MTHPRCIVIDPSALVAETIGAALEFRGFDATVAFTHSQAELLLATSRVPALIVANYAMLHERTGPTLLASAMRAMPQVPVVVISSNPESFLPASESRWAVLAEPFGLADLRAAVVRAYQLVDRNSHGLAVAVENAPPAILAFDAQKSNVAGAHAVASRRSKRTFKCFGSARTIAD